MQSSIRLTRESSSLLVLRLGTQPNRLSSPLLRSEQYAIHPAFFAMDSVKTRIQAGTANPAAGALKKDPQAMTLRKNTGLLEGVVAIARSKEGVKGLYKGFGASMVNTFSTRTSCFLFHRSPALLHIASH